jgi:tetratricopeptide (TPR) repeat protein
MPPHQRAQINNRIASYYFRMQRYKEALPYMREAVRLDPQDYPTLCNLAAVLMSMGETREAGFFLKTMDTARIQDARLLFSVFFNRACLYSLSSEPGNALDDLKKAAQTDPHSTLASLGDPQLDNIRPSLEFFDLKARLEAIIAPTAPVSPTPQ